LEDLCVVFFRELPLSLGEFAGNFLRIRMGSGDEAMSLPLTQDRGYSNIQHHPKMPGISAVLEQQATTYDHQLSTHSLEMLRTI
jgi:hypothetical protein